MLQCVYYTLPKWSHALYAITIYSMQDASQPFSNERSRLDSLTLTCVLRERILFPELPIPHCWGTGLHYTGSLLVTWMHCATMPFSPLSSPCHLHPYWPPPPHLAHVLLPTSRVFPTPSGRRQRPLYEALVYIKRLRSSGTTHRSQQSSRCNDFLSWAF